MWTCVHVNMHSFVYYDSVIFMIESRPTVQGTYEKLIKFKKKNNQE